MYHVATKDTKLYGTVIGINEYLKNNKWIKPKGVTIGTESKKLTDEMLNDFIDKYKPEEINFIMKDKKGEFHFVDFTLEDLL